MNKEYNNPIKLAGWSRTTLILANNYLPVIGNVCASSK